MREPTDKQIDKAILKYLEEEIARKKAEGKPIAKYDKELKKAYLEYPDGRREYS